MDILHLAMLMLTLIEQRTKAPRYESHKSYKCWKPVITAFPLPSLFSDSEGSCGLRILYPW